MSQSAFDDLLDLGGASENVNQSADPFDFLGSSQTTNQNNSTTSSSLLDLGFDSEVSTKNVQSSGSVEINTNPLYEFTKTNNSLDIMASETDNSTLLDFGIEPQKEVKTDPSSNPLYDFIQSENTNGHADDILTNGDTQTMDLLDNSGDLLGEDNTGDLLGGDNTGDQHKGDNTGDQHKGDNTGDLLGSDNTGDQHKGDNTEDLLKGDNTEDLLQGDDSTDLLGGAVTSDDSGVTMDLNNVSEIQKEDEREEEQTEDVVEEQMEGETEETEEDQDTGNVEEIVSEQITEPETDDQLEDDFKDEVEEGPVNPDIVSENTLNEPEEGKKILGKTSEKPNNLTNDSEVIVDKPIDTKEVLVESNNPEVEGKTVEENGTHSNDEQEDEKVNIEDSKSVEPNNEEIRTDDEQVESESIEPLPKDECDTKVEGETIEKDEEEPGFVPDGQNEKINEEEEMTAEVPDDTKEKQELENEKETFDIQVGDILQKEEIQDTESLPVNVDTIEEKSLEDKSKEGEDDMPTEEIESVMQRTEPLMEAEDQAEEATEKPNHSELDDTAQAFKEPDSQAGTNEKVEESGITETEEVSKDEPILEGTSDIVTNTKIDYKESTQPEIIVDDSLTSQVDDNEPIMVQEPEVDELNQSVDPNLTDKDVQEPPNDSTALQAVDNEPVIVKEPDVNELNQFVDPELKEEDVEERPNEPDDIDFVDKAIPDERVQQDTLEIGESDKKKEDAVKQEPDEIKKPEPVEEENAVKLNGANDVKENGVPEDEVIRDPNVYRETREKEEVKFAELNSFREKFETGAISDGEPTLKKTSVKDEYDEGGEFENTPTVNEDVVKETDQQKEELPEVGMAKNLLNKFKSLQEESSQVKTSQKRVSPPRDEKVEYENEPEQRNLVYENKSDEGVFESTPESKEDVVRCGDKSEDVQVEKGYTKNVLSKLKEIETESSVYKAREKRELTPDTSGKVEYVSEPRGEHITYGETKVETGVYENVPKEEEDIVRSGDKAEEVLPESGMAKNLLSKFKQLESETVNQPPPSPKRTTSYEPKPREQKGYLERFSPKLEEGEFENEPVVPKEVIRSGDQQEDFKPESGAAKKTMELFKEFEKTGGSPKAPDYRKEFTPPREASPGKTVAGVLENEPVNRPDVVRNADKTVDELPEQGTARNIMEKFKQIQSAENSPSSSPTKKYKEFTPPPESGVYENAPKEHIIIEQIQSESGVLESTPEKSVADVPRQQRETLSPEQELPEKGMAKNLVSKFKQLENESAKTSKSTSPSKFKEFTPPRDTRTILSPKSPAGQQNGVHPSDLPEQYQEQTSPGIFESNPEQRKDVFREADTDWEQGLPAKNTTASMLERFKAIQDKAKEDEQSQAPISRKGLQSISKTSGKTVSRVSENEPVNRPNVEQNVDKTDDEMPEHGMARNIMEKFNKIQSADNSSSSSLTKQHKVLTSTSESCVNENPPKEQMIIEQIQSESGVLESTPEKSAADIPRQERETLSPEQELPEKGMARNLVSKFKQLENESAKNSKSTSPSKFKEFTPPRDTRTILSPKSPAGQQNGVHPSDLREQYQEQTSPGIFEGNSEQRKDVYRESDTDLEHELPAKNTTASMLERFKAIQEKAKEDEQSQASFSRKEKGMFRVVQTEKCAACQKTVYAMEKLEMSSHIYHKNCFKCSHCSARLTPKSFSMNEGVIYCTNHFKQLFARKGNYDEGFGRQQYKKKWGDDKSKNDDSSATA